jgi:hypothetical protein
MVPRHGCHALSLPFPSRRCFKPEVLRFASGDGHGGTPPRFPKKVREIG